MQNAPAKVASLRDFDVDYRGLYLALAEAVAVRIATKKNQLVVAKPDDVAKLQGEIRGLELCFTSMSELEIGAGVDPRGVGHQKEDSDA